jgi:flagellar protein FlaJ
MAKIELAKERKILIVSIIFSGIMIFIGVVSGDLGVLGNTVILSSFIIITPQLIFSYVSYRKVKEIELKFPHFLRDLVEATRAGMPLHKAIVFTNHRDYGLLTPEIQKMSNQISWNVPIIKVLNQAKKRLKKSKTLEKMFRIIIETYKSGGSVDNTLDALSNTMMTIQDTEKERKSALNQYVVAMYVISVVFIGIIVGINWLMIPVFKSLTIQNTGMEGGMGGMGGGISNPCGLCLQVTGPGCMPCSIYFSICSVFRVDKSGISCYYLALFFSISVIQSIMGGLVAGQIGEDSVTAGIKHSLILTAATIGAFFILVSLGFLGG